MNRLENIEAKMKEIAKLSKQIETLAKREYGEGAHLALSEGDMLYLFTDSEIDSNNVATKTTVNITAFTW